jgi:hypothetical protein
MKMLKQSYERLEMGDTDRTKAIEFRVGGRRDGKGAA